MDFLLIILCLNPVSMQSKMVCFLAVINRGTCTNTSECNKRDLCRTQSRVQLKLCIRKMYHLISFLILKIFLRYQNTNGVFVPLLDCFDSFQCNSLQIFFFLICFSFFYVEWTLYCLLVLLRMLNASKGQDIFVFPAMHQLYESCDDVISFENGESKEIGGRRINQSKQFYETACGSKENI